MARAVGLDIGAHHVRLVEIEGGGKSVRVHRLGEREIGDVPDGVERREVVRDAVAALFKDTDVKPGEVVMAWPAEQCIMRDITVPFREPDQIRKVIKFEFESHLHSDAIEDVVVDFEITGESREGARVLAIGAAKDELLAMLHDLDAVGVDPVSIDIDVASLVDAASAAGTLGQYPDCVLLDIGARSTKIVLVVGGRLRGARAMRGGLDSLAARVADDVGGDGEALALDGPRADDLLAVPPARNDGDTPPAELSAATLEVAVVEDRRSDFLGRLARELTRTLGRSAPGVSFPALLLTGRGGRVPGVAAHLGEQLGLDVVDLDLFGSCEHPIPPDLLDDANATYAVAFGAACRALRLGPLELDLRRENVAFARRFDQVKNGVAALLALLLLAVGFLLFRAKTEKEVAQQEFVTMASTVRTTQERVEAQYRRDIGEDEFERLPNTNGEQLLIVPDANRRVKSMRSHLQNELGLSTEVPPIHSSLDTFLRVNQALAGVREQIEYFVVKSENYTQRNGELQVIVSAPGDIDVIKSALEKITSGGEGEEAGSPYFARVDYARVQQGRDGKYPITFTLEWPEGRGGQ